MVLLARTRRRRLALVALVSGLAMLPLGRALAASPTPTLGPTAGGNGDQVVILGGVSVPRGTSVGEIVVFSGSAQVAGIARGDVVVVAGPIAISGQVSGSVIALDGSIHLSATAQVSGDVLARDDVIVARGATVGGSVRRGVAFTLAGPLRIFGPFTSWLEIAVSTLLLGSFMALVAPRSLERTALAGRTATGATVAWGVATAIAAPLLGVASVASVAGLPLGLGVLFSLVLVALVGAVTTVHTVGRALLGDRGGPATAFLAGWGIATLVGLIPYVSGVAFLGASVFGTGEIVVATWRARDSRRQGRHRSGYVPQAPPDAGDAPGL